MQQQATRSTSFFTAYWKQHPTQQTILRAFLAGEWVTRSFGWFYMMISRFAGPVMTIAVAYLILYAIDSHHGLATVVLHPTLWDTLASFSSGVINVTPELVFPGTVVLCIQAFLRKRWLHGVLYTVASIVFAVLTMILLQAFMSNGITDAFLSGMLLWRAASSLFYTVVAEFCSHHATEEAPLLQQQQVQSRLDEMTNTFSQRLEALQLQLQQQRTEATGQTEALKAELQSMQQLQSEVTALKERFTSAPTPPAKKQRQQQKAPQPTPGGRSHLRVLPPGEQADSSKRAFVFHCLDKEAHLKLKDIQTKAREAGQSISEASISVYRNEYFQHLKKSPTSASTPSGSTEAHEAEATEEQTDQH